ncbi:uncharacterized protein DUF262 [Maricaulis maris]|uniref:Uncharacterized protein DUF262 n=1 Tax=Maricaulis maris TaxID=74318 RepID=A0A495CW15_9PROT|nr:uncharacterized protein DUF262 [Maricaulis maris]
MQSPLNAAAQTVGALFSDSTFLIPQYQREYSWQDEEVSEFWSDLSGSLEQDAYFLGLVILTDEGDVRHVVDGQQRIITLTLLAMALYIEAVDRGRAALAERIQAEFLQTIDYSTDETHSRVKLSDPVDNETFQAILINKGTPNGVGDGEVSKRLIAAFNYIRNALRHDLRGDPFKRLGKWTEFLNKKVYFAVFVHPDAATAYQVFEVINTRGRDLTTADLLKNYILSQTSPPNREDRYQQWQSISRVFPPEGSNNTFVQYIRHVVTVGCGHVLPKNLFKFLAQRQLVQGRTPPNPDQLMAELEKFLPVYQQIIEPETSGPASDFALRVFDSLNHLGVMTVRPILLAMKELEDGDAGMEFLLRLVVRRIVVGNLGTGNVERRMGDVAKKIAETNNWRHLQTDLRDLNPSRDEFVNQLSRRSFNKGTLTFVRRSLIENSICPSDQGILHFIWQRKGMEHWGEISEEEGSFWAATIGNTFLSDLKRRPDDATRSWEGFKSSMINDTAHGEDLTAFLDVHEWRPEVIQHFGEVAAERAAKLWYGSDV